MKKLLLSILIILSCLQLNAQLCSAPTGLTATESCGIFCNPQHYLLSWSPISGAINFDVRVRPITSPESPWQETFGIPAFSFIYTQVNVFDECDRLLSYEWQVRSTCSDGSKSDYAATSQFTPVNYGGIVTLPSNSVTAITTTTPLPTSSTLTTATFSWTGPFQSYPVGTVVMHHITITEEGHGVIKNESYFATIGSTPVRSYSLPQGKKCIVSISVSTSADISNPYSCRRVFGNPKTNNFTTPTSATVNLNCNASGLNAFEVNNSRTTAAKLTPPQTAFASFKTVSGSVSDYYSFSSKITAPSSVTTVDVTVVINYMPYNNATLRLQSFTGLTQATIPLNYSNRIITFQVPRNTTNYLYFTHPGAAPNTGSSGCYSFSIALAPSSGSLRTSDEHLSNNTFESKDMQRTITFSPNPVESGTTLHFPELTDVTIFDLSGKMVSNFKATNQINTDNLKAGVYFMRFNGYATEKLVVY
ncbi:MAG: hypothetical protein BWY67_01004 [Bacteroidetes bacterium ADurb.Bin397]|jgi:hypothetical protein|nr:MAG: hypothetical protein BWY67_01004 [Bacteroidetes bacterium ADurb.Bin397]